MFDKKCKFKCKIEVVALSQTPYLCGNIYCTLKLQNGGKFARNTEQKSINNHEVIWSEAFDFLFEALLDKKTRKSYTRAKNVFSIGQEKLRIVGSGALIQSILSMCTYCILLLCTKKLLGVLIEG